MSDDRIRERGSISSIYENRWTRTKMACESGHRQPERQRGTRITHSHLSASHFNYLFILSQAVSPPLLLGPTGSKWTFVYLRSILTVLETIYEALVMCQVIDTCAGVESLRTDPYCTEEETPLERLSSRPRPHH